MNPQTSSYAMPQRIGHDISDYLERIIERAAKRDAQTTPPRSDVK